jgi:hypothetical protein
VSVPVKIWADAEPTKISRINVKSRTESRPVKRLLLELALGIIIFTPNRIATNCILIGYNRIAPASSGYRSNFVKILTARRN